MFDLTKCTFFFAQSPSMCAQGSPGIPGRNEHNGLAGWKRRGSSTWTTWYKSTSEKGRCWRKELETTRLEKGWCWLMLWCCPYSGERETILYSLCCRARVYYPTLLSPSPLDRDCHVSETVGWIFQRYSDVSCWPRVTLRKGCFEYPRPFEWSLIRRLKMMGWMR